VFCPRERNKKSCRCPRGLLNGVPAVLFYLGPEVIAALLGRMKGLAGIRKRVADSHGQM